MIYSVIIPFRGSMSLLCTALNSVPDRDDIQIIVVDNNPVAVDVICFPRTEHSTMVILRSDPEKGAGYARNVGLDAAEGEFVLFLDADDYFTEDAFEQFDKFLEAGNDITYFKATSVMLSSGLPSNRHKNICEQIDTYFKSGDEDWVRLRIENPVGKMFLKKFLDSGNFRFEELNCSNDTMFSITTGYYAKKIGVSDSVVYTITEGESGSTLTSNRSKENQFVRFGVSLRRNKFLEEAGKSKFRIRLLPSIYLAFSEWGIAEGLRYISCAKKSGANIFVGYLGI